ncbi:hypothetical protein ACF0H5_011404 [Mactra antiquata]
MLDYFCVNINLLGKLNSLIDYHLVLYCCIKHSNNSSNKKTCLTINPWIRCDTWWPWQVMSFHENISTIIIILCNYQFSSMYRNVLELRVRRQIGQSAATFYSPTEQLHVLEYPIDMYI